MFSFQILTFRLENKSFSGIIQSSILDFSQNTVAYCLIFPEINITEYMSPLSFRMQYVSLSTTIIKI